MEMQSKKIKTELEKAIKNKESKVFLKSNIEYIKNACSKFITESAVYTEVLEIRCLNE